MDISVLISSNKHPVNVFINNWIEQDESSNIIHGKLFRKQQSIEFKKWLKKIIDSSNVKIKYDVFAKVY